ncbi:MAG: hypothetical protein ACRDNK_24175, partial [Solirubrobacteraceae bacterium]
MRSLIAAAVVLIVVVGVTSAAWGGSVRATIRAAPAVTRTHFKPLPALAPALRKAIAELARRRGSHRRIVTAPQAVVPGSGTCFVGAGACTEHPCIVYTGPSSSSAVYAPLPVTGRATKCSRATGMARVSAAMAI